MNQITCQKIISGGQTGVDRGALDAAIEDGFPCGGWCPEGRKAENGPIPLKYPLKELPAGDYNDRTKANVTDSDGTLIIYNGQLKGGTLLSFKHSKLESKPVLALKVCNIDQEMNESLNIIFKWLNFNQINILNVSGPRLSEWPGGYGTAYRIIKEIIKESLTIKPE